MDRLETIRINQLDKIQLKTDNLYINKMCNQNYNDGAALFSHVPCTLWSWTALMDPVVSSFSSGLIIIVH